LDGGIMHKNVVCATRSALVLYFNFIVLITHPPCRHIASLPLQDSMQCMP